MRLVRSHHEREPNMLLTSLALWADFADTAPHWRLDALSFVVSDTRQVLVRGRPLPPIPGEHWVERERICVPAGWDWTPALSPSVCRELLGSRRRSSDSCFRPVTKLRPDAAN